MKDQYTEALIGDKDFSVCHTKVRTAYKGVEQYPVVTVMPMMFKPGDKVKVIIVRE